jgi:hypothetical protein
MSYTIKEIKVDFVGETLPSTKNGESGRAFEKLFEEKTGFKVRAGKGVDCIIHGALVELKTRSLDSKSSAQAIAAMHYEDIASTPYEFSSICKKFQVQFRVKTRNNVIVEQGIYNFSDEGIQRLIKGAYEEARANLIARLNDLRNGEVITYFPGNKWGYFDVKRGSNSFAFRITEDAFRELEFMAETRENNPITFN